MNWQRINIPLGKGIDGDTDPRQVPVGRLSVLENGRFRKRGAINKRNGHAELSNAVASTGALHARGNHLILAGKQNMYVRDSLGSSWSSLGTWTPMSVSYETVGARGDYGGLVSQECGRANGLELYAWQETIPASASSQIRYVMRRAGTGELVLQSTISATQPRVLVAGNYILLFYVENAIGRDLYVRRFDTSGTSVIVTDTVIDTASSNTASVDAVTAPSGDVYIAYHINAGTETRIRRYAPSNFAAALNTYDTAVLMTGDPALAVTPDNRLFYFSRNNGNSVRGFLFSSTLAATYSDVDMGVACTVNRGITAKVRTTQEGGQYACYVLIGHNNGGSVWRGGISGFVWNTNNTFGTMSLFSGMFTNRIQLAARIWEDTSNDRLYVICRSGWASPAYYVYDLRNNLIVAQIMPGEASIHTASQFESHLPIVLPSGNTYLTALVGVDSYRVSGDDRESIVNDIGREVVRTELTFFDAAANVSQEAGAATYFCGGMVNKFNGASLLESGIFEILDGGVAQVNTTGGSGFLANGNSVSYRFLPERHLPNGEVEVGVSLGSWEVDNVAGASRNVNVQAPCISVTNDTEYLVIGIYRSEQYTTGGTYGGQYYRVGALKNERADNGTANHWTSAVFLDDTTDAELLKLPMHPLDAGIVENVPPGAASVMAEGQGRIWLAGFRDPNKVLFSKVRGWGEPVNFTDSFSITLPEGGGPVTGFAANGDGMVIFKENAAYAIVGAGPDSLGSGIFSDPRVIANAIGCADQRSICPTTVGVLFKHTSGWYMVRPNWSVEFIGGPAQPYDSQDVTSAIAVPGTSEVRMTTSSGSSLVYDYEMDQWGTDSRTAAGAAYVNGVYYFSKADGAAVYQETGFAEGTSYVATTVTTGWIRLTELQGFWKARWLHVLGEYKSAHTLRIRIAYDYDDAWVDTFTNVPVSGQRLQSRFRFSRQKVQAVKIEIKDINPTGESFVLTELGIEVGMNKGGARLGVNRTGSEI